MTAYPPDGHYLHIPNAARSIAETYGTVLDHLWDAQFNVVGYVIAPFNEMMAELAIQETNAIWHDR